MPDRESENRNPRRPQGFTPHSGGLASEYAREQGWGINEDERTKTPRQKQAYDGGRDYDYGPRDFGDTAEDTGSAERAAERIRARPGRPKKAA